MIEEKQNSNIRVGRQAGFCFGVRRAAEALENRIEISATGERIYTLGKLIHNDSYLRFLEAKGVRVIGEGEILTIASSATEKNPVTVLIRAHGISKTAEQTLNYAAESNRYFKFIDCTCPYVKKIHKIAAENSGDGICFVLMGSKNHPEVIGIMSCLNGEGHVFSSADEFERAADEGALGDLHKKRLCLAAQTTFDLSEWEKTQKISKRLCTNPLIFDTICDVTEKRQIEAEAISRDSELMIVIGSEDSSNTKKLYNICKKNCPSTYLVADADELSALMPKIKDQLSLKRTGIVAGASTPVGIIQEVYNIMIEITEIKAENFEEMLENSLNTLNTGDTVTGYVTSVTDAELQLDLGANVTGVITADQATDDPTAKLTSLFKVGDLVDAYVIKISDVDGVATLSKKRIDSQKNWNKIVDAKESGEVLAGKVVAVNKGGVEVSVNSNRVFVPASQTGLPKGEDMSKLVGKNVKVKIIETKDQGKRAVGSIRLVLIDEKRAREEEFWNNIHVGKQYKGKVKSMTSYGAFVDLGGVDGMVHTSELSWKHIKSPAEVVSVGDELLVFVKSYDPERKRISLGYKTEDTEPWKVFTGNYAVGDVVSVKIVSLMPFGAFAEIIDGVDGLIHISQISTQRIKNPQDVLNIGDVVDVKIIAIDEEKRKVSLSITALLENSAEAEE